MKGAPRKKLMNVCSWIMYGGLFISCVLVFMINDPIEGIRAAFGLLLLYVGGYVIDAILSKEDE